MANIYNAQSSNTQTYIILAKMLRAANNPLVKNSLYVFLDCTSLFPESLNVMHCTSLTNRDVQNEGVITKLETSIWYWFTKWPACGVPETFWKMNI